jgi:hypothetical protein
MILSMFGKKADTLSNRSVNIQRTSPASANNQNFAFREKVTDKEVVKSLESMVWFVWKPGSQPYICLRFGRRKDLISEGICMEMIPQIPLGDRLNRKLILIIENLFEEGNAFTQNHFRSHAKRSMSWAEKFRLY